MTKNPILNGIAAGAYIVGIASFMFYLPPYLSPIDTVFAPITLLSLFVFSAAVMSTIFFYEPVLLYLDGKKREAVQLFFQTLGTFAVITLLFLAALFFIH